MDQTADGRELFVILVADGIAEVNAAYEVGWTPRQLRTNLKDPSFVEMVQAARDRADGTIEGALFKVAAAGNFGAMQWWLLNRKPDTWKDTKRIEIRNDTTVTIG